MRSETISASGIGKSPLFLGVRADPHHNTQQQALYAPNSRVKQHSAFPMGLPDYDPVRLVIEGTDGLDGTQAGTELLDENTAGLWMAGKEFRRDQAVGDRVGKNEKTRVTCKLQNPGSGPPGREPAVSEEERKAMMAYYFKRQEELKRLSEVSVQYLSVGGPCRGLCTWPSRRSSFVLRYLLPWNTT